MANSPYGSSVNQPAPLPGPSPQGQQIMRGAELGWQQTTPWDEAIRNAASTYGLDPDVFRRQLYQESHFNPSARSPAGAQGIAQFTPGTAQQYGLTDPYDPIASINASAHYNSDLLKQFGGDQSKALAAYNAGPGTVNRYNGIPPYPETQNYVNTILGQQPQRQPQAGASGQQKPSTAEQIFGYAEKGKDYYDKYNTGRNIYNSLTTSAATAPATPNVLGVDRISSATAPSSNAPNILEANVYDQPGLLATGASLLGGAAGAYGLYKIGQNFGQGNRSGKSIAINTAGGALSGLGIGSAVGTGVGLAAGAAAGATMGAAAGPIGAAIGAAFGIAASLIKSGKQDNQKMRDYVRKGMVKKGFITDDFKLELANGSFYDIGKDGGKRKEYGGLRPHEVDRSRPFSVEATGTTQPLAVIMLGGDGGIVNKKGEQNNGEGNKKMEGLKHNFSGYFTNAALQDATGINDVIANARHFYEKAGIPDAQTAIGAIDEMVAKGTVKPENRDAYVNGINQVFGVAPTAPAPNQGSPGSRQPQLKNTPATRQKRRQEAKPILSAPAPIPSPNAAPLPTFDLQAYSQQLQDQEARKRLPPLSFPYQNRPLMY